MFTKTLAAAAFLAAFGLIGFFAMPTATTVVAAETSGGCACACCENCECTADCGETCDCAECHAVAACCDVEKTPAPKPEEMPCNTGGGCCG